MHMAAAKANGRERCYQPCAKCGEDFKCGYLSGRCAPRWRRCPGDDELCDWCRDDVEWRKVFIREPLSEQLMHTASFSDFRRVEKLVNQGAPLSCVHSGMGTDTPAPASACDGKHCAFRLTAVAAALLEKIEEEEFDDVYRIIEILLR